MPKVLGREQLHKRLLALPQAITEGIHEGLAEVAAPISAQQKSLLLNDPKLQAATGWKFADYLKVIIYSGSKEAFWAHWREFGTHPHSLHKGASLKAGRLEDKGPHHPGEHASPYFYPIWRLNKPFAKKTITKAVNAAMKKVAEQP